jgi:hypothetical protein
MCSTLPQTRRRTGLRSHSLALRKCVLGSILLEEHKDVMAIGEELKKQQALRATIEVRLAA